MQFINELPRVDLNQTHLYWSTSILIFTGKFEFSVAQLAPKILISFWKYRKYKFPEKEISFKPNNKLMTLVPTKGSRTTYQSKLIPTTIHVKDCLG